MEGIQNILTTRTKESPMHASKELHSRTCASASANKPIALTVLNTKIKTENSNAR